MKAIIQRVSRACVSIDNKITGEIGPGFVILLGITHGDAKPEAELLAAKIAKLRVFLDDEGKMNRSLLEIGGAALCISQFTLCADVKKGNRPSFTDAARPEISEPLYEYVCARLRKEGIADVQTGIFGAEMHVELVNHGPVTISLDTEIWRRGKC